VYLKSHRVIFSQFTLKDYFEAENKHFKKQKKVTYWTRLCHC